MVKKVRKRSAAAMAARQKREQELMKGKIVRRKTPPIDLDSDAVSFKRYMTMSNVAKKRKQELELVTDRVRRYSYMRTGEDSEKYMRVPPFTGIMTYGQAYSISRLSPDLSMIYNTLENAIFKGGSEWVPRWTCKCPKCDTKFYGDEPYDTCPICDPAYDMVWDKLLTLLTEESLTPDKIETVMGNQMVDHEQETMIIPDKRQYEWADEMFKNCNRLNQSLADIERVMERDLNVVDTGMYILRWRYKSVGEDGVPKSKELLEIQRGHPKFMRKVVDTYNRVGGHYWKCIIHTDQVTKKIKWAGPRTDTNFTQPRCPICNRLMHDVLYVQLSQERQSLEDYSSNGYFLKGEVLEGHYYQPDGLWGQPPIMSLGIHAQTLLAENTYMRDTFVHRQLPQTGVYMITSNPFGAEKRVNQMLERVHEDPTEPLIFYVEPGEFKGDGMIDTIQLMPKLHEMDYIPSREEMRNQLCNFYGVFYEKSSKESAAGAATDQPTMSVDPDTLEAKQTWWNRMRRKLTEEIGIVDWDYECVPTDVKGVFRKLQISQLEWQIAQMAQTVGFETVRDVNGNLRQVQALLTNDDLGMLRDILMAIVEQEQVEQGPRFESNPTYTPDTEQTPTGEPGEKHGLKKALGESVGMQMRMNTGARPRTGAGSPGNPQSAATTTPGTKEDYGKDGKSFETKQEMGGAATGTTTPSDLKGMKVLVWYILEHIRARSKPMTVLGNQSDR